MVRCSHAILHNSPAILHETLPSLKHNVSCDQVERDLLQDGYHGDVIGEVTPAFVLENVVSGQRRCIDYAAFICT